MDDLFLAVMQRLSTLDGISVIDENKGQLTSYDDGYPITFPAILIDLPVTEWGDATREQQTGVTTLVVSLVIDCYHDTHYGSTQEEDVREHLNLFKSMHELLQGFKPSDNCGRLCRQSTRMYADGHQIRVYEHTYQCKVTETFSMPYDGRMSVGMKADKG